MRHVVDSYAEPIDRFFAYARERHRIFLRREEGLPRSEWTDDPILRKFRFTNVFREFDKTTVWMMRYVRLPYASSPNLLLACVMFRMFNRISTGELIFCTMDFDKKTPFDHFAETGDLSHTRRALRSVGGPVATGAYIISSPPGYTKAEGILQTVLDFRNLKAPYRGRDVGWREMTEILSAKGADHSMREVWEWLRQYPFFGNFHSYEIVCDLRFTRLLHRATDALSWANLGPGARRGLNRIFYHREMNKLGDRKKWGQPMTTPEVYNQLMVNLLLASRNVKNWPRAQRASTRSREIRVEWPKWELREVEHTLCEFDKYCRVLNGEGTPRGVFR